MKKILLVTLISAIGLSTNAQTKAKAAPAKKPTTVAKNIAKPVVKAPTFKNNLDSASYALGLSVASSFKAGGLNNINYDLFNKGIKDMFAGTEPILSQQVAEGAINKLFESFSKQREEGEKAKYVDIINAGNTFLAQNKVKPGIKTTASGLQYEVITAGTGATPTATDQVTVNYKGTLLDGTQFDSSYDRGQPVSFALNRVIPGWTEGVQLMKEGSKYRFFIPYHLAYNSHGTPDGSIPPFSTLIFEVELIKIGQPETN